MRWVVTFILCSSIAAPAFAQDSDEEPELGRGSDEDPWAEDPAPPEPAENRHEAFFGDSQPAAQADVEVEIADPSQRAQVFAVLSVGGDAPPDVARQAREAVAEAVTREGVQIVADADVALAVSPARLRACRRASCAYEIGLELNASVTIAVATWTGGGGSLSVSVISGPSRSQSATEPIRDGDVAGAAGRAVRAALAARRRAFLVEGTSGGSASDGPAAGGDASEGESAASSEGGDTVGDQTVLSRERSLEEWILPTLLGVVGIGLAGLSVYSLLDEFCDREGPSGICLAGSRPNLGLGIVMSIVGSLSIAGAVIWLIVGGQPNPEIGRIDVVVGPDGGGLSWRGVF